MLNSLQVSFRRTYALCRIYITALLVCLCIPYKAKGQQGTDSTLLPEYKYEPYQELEKHYQYLAKLQQKKDSLKFVLRHSLAIGFSYGHFVIPWYNKTGVDSLTGTDISAQTRQWTLFAEYYHNENQTSGLEINIQGVKREQNISAGGGGININASGGTNICVMLSGKYIWSKTAAANHKAIYDTLQHPAPEYYAISIDKANSINNARMRKPRLYNTLGAGFTQTVLLKLKGNPYIALSKKSYMQAVPTLFVGMGVYSRLSRCLAIDLGARYVLSKAYSPGIGSISSYSGFNIRLSIAILFNTGYNSVKNKLINEEVNHH